MRIAVTYGPMCLQRSPEETWHDPRTGSEVGWRRIVEGLRAWHDVDSPPYRRFPYDWAISINEPDALRQFERSYLPAPNTPELAAPRRICMFWLNEFSFCKEGFDDHVDVYCSPSEAHRQKAITDWGAPKPDKWTVIPLGCDPGGFRCGPKVSGRVVYCSSPDRGLHRLLEAWPRIKRAVPHASLRIFYRLDPWLRGFDETPFYPPIEKLRNRALYVEQALKRLSGPEWGIEVFDSVDRTRLHRELDQAECFAYGCETTSWSEGFSCSTLEACAAEACPILSDCDALADVYASLAPVRVGEWDTWRERVILALTDEAFRTEHNAKARALAERLTWEAHAKRLDEVIRGKLNV